MDTAPPLRQQVYLMVHFVTRWNPKLFFLVKKNSLRWIVFDYKDGGRRRIGDSARQWGAPLFPSHLPPWAKHHAIFILSRWDIHSAEQAGFIQKVPAVLPLSTCSMPADPSLSKPVVTIKTWYGGWGGGFLANTPTRSKSKCAIKNAHLCSSSRLSNAYASYPRDQVKWFRKWYRISFIRDTIHISSVGCWGVVGWGVFSLCYHTVWTLGKWETEKALVERHPSGCCLDSRLLNAADSFPSSTQNVKISWDESVVRAEKTWCNAGDSPCYRQPTRQHRARNYRWCKLLEIDWKHRKKSLSRYNNT